MIIFIHIYPPENWYKNERIQTFLSVTKLDISVGIYDFMACYQFLECTFLLRHHAHLNCFNHHTSTINDYKHNHNVRPDRVLSQVV